MAHALAERKKPHQQLQSKKNTKEKGQFLALKNVEDCLLSASFFDSHTD